MNLTIEVDAIRANQEFVDTVILTLADHRWAVIDEEFGVVDIDSRIRTINLIVRAEKTEGGGLIGIGADRSKKILVILPNVVASEEGSMSN